MTIVRDRFWIWGHEAGSHTTEEWGVPEPSRITPVEGAFYMGVPNVILVRYGGKPAAPYHQAAVPFRALRSVVWSIVGAGGTSQDEELGHVLDLAAELPNLTGVMMDDFFLDPAKHDDVAVLSLDQLRAIRKRLGLRDRRLTLPKRLDLYAVLYDHQLDFPVAEHLALCDKLTFWTSSARDLANLERNLDRVDALAPSCGKLLGCYMWDYAPKQPMPVETMQRQCELGLKWLREGRIEGMIFLATCICDLDLEAVEWTRRWIAKVGGGRI